MTTRDIYLKIEHILDYTPVEPESSVMWPKEYKRDCMRNPGHLDGTIPLSEVNTRKLNALVYREYLDPNYHIPKPDKLVIADINEPIFYRRVPGAVIYVHADVRLRIHVLNADNAAHSFHVHGLAYGIDSDGSWPFGTQATDGRRSDEICPGQTWTYVFDVKERMIGAWPFHDHYQKITDSANRGLFGAIIVLPHEMKGPPKLELPPGFDESEKNNSKIISSQASRSSQSDSASAAFDSVSLKREALKEWVKHGESMMPDRNMILHVPLFYHVMNGSGVSAFDSGDLHSMDFFEVIFGAEGVFTYHCSHHPIMQGRVRVEMGGPTIVSVRIVDTPDMKFDPPEIVVGPGGKVHWEHHGQYEHTVTDGGGGLPTFCFNGRAYVGNTPTVVAYTGQKIRWYVFNLDLGGMTWHNFHPHAQSLKFADNEIDTRSLGPAESFVLETTAPPCVVSPHMPTQLTPLFLTSRAFSLSAVTSPVEASSKFIFVI